MELEKEAVALERRELFEQRKAQKNKIQQLTNQVATVEMVSLGKAALWKGEHDS